MRTETVYVFRMDLMQNKHSMNFRSCHFCFPTVNQFPTQSLYSVSRKRSNKGTDEQRVDQMVLLQCLKEIQETTLHATCVQPSVYLKERN